MDTLSRCMMCSISSTGKIRNYEICVGTTKLLAVPFTYVFLRLGGDPTTGLLVNIGIEIVCIFQRLWFNQRLLQFPVLSFLKNVVAKCWIIFVLSYFVCYVIAKYIEESLGLIIITGVINTLVLYCIGLSKNERTLINSKLLPVIAKALKK